MRLYFLIAISILPLCAFAYTSVIATPKDQAAVLTIENPAQAQELFGQLHDFPHTFEFEVKKEIDFKASVSVQDSVLQKNDISVIVVKNERRGVSEIGRTKIGEQQWKSDYDPVLAESFRSGGALQYTLAPGTYKLEVSSPNNEGKYRLVLGTKKIHRGYFENLRTLFEVKSFLGKSYITALLSPLMYVPLLIVLILAGMYALHWKKKIQA